MKNTPQVKVSIKYEWEFSLKEWTSLKKFEEDYEIAQLIEKVKWDGVSIFHHLNDMVRPTTKLHIEKSN
tara:strand:- start:224 stop:430 length:207 start_codon:yes stop_codon:yes gene_type:complete